MVALAAGPFVIKSDGFAGGVSDVGVARGRIPKEFYGVVIASPSRNHAGFL